jgi:ADP-ribosylglycohydrolase
VRDGREFLERMDANSEGSGAAMRAGPLGVLPDVAEVLERSRFQAVLTHNTPRGIAAAQAAALMTHYLLYSLGPLPELGAFVEKHVPGEWDAPWAGEAGAPGWQSVRAALTAMRRNRRLSDLLRDCINFGGDVDTVATIALAAASCSRDFERDLPAQLVAGLENGPYGRDYLAEMDHRLLALAKRGAVFGPRHERRG